MKSYALALRANAAQSRREEFDGKVHVVIPVIMAANVVMNEAFVPDREWQASVKSWDGRPVVVYHPEENGRHILASSRPDVFERRVGFLFNTKYEDAKLKSELWLDPEAMEALGQAEVLAAMESGENVFEVSTGYISDALAEEGVHDGKRYRFIHVNIRPDHLALLPGQTGACSVADGCGAPRVNNCQCSKCAGAHHTNEVSEMDIKKALQVLATAMRKDQKKEIDVLALAQQLHTNEQLTLKQFKAIQEMDDEQRSMIKVLLEAMDKSTNEEEPPTEEEDEAAMKAKADAAAAAAQQQAQQQQTVNTAMATLLKTMTDLGTTVANLANEVKDLKSGKSLVEVVNTASRRSALIEQIVANEAAGFKREELEGLDTKILEKLAANSRPADYSGMGNYASNAESTEAADALRVNTGLFLVKPAAKK